MSNKPSLAMKICLWWLYNARNEIVLKNINGEAQQILNFYYPYIAQAILP